MSHNVKHVERIYVAGYKFLRQHTHVPISMHTATHFGDASLEMARSYCS